MVQSDFRGERRFDDSLLADRADREIIQPIVGEKQPPVNLHIDRNGYELVCDLDDEGIIRDPEIALWLVRRHGQRELGELIHYINTDEATFHLTQRMREYSISETFASTILEEDDIRGHYNFNEDELQYAVSDLADRVHTIEPRIIVERLHSRCGIDIDEAKRQVTQACYAQFCKPENKLKGTTVERDIALLSFALSQGSIPNEVLMEVIPHAISIIDRYSASRAPHFLSLRNMLTTRLKDELEKAPEDTQAAIREKVTDLFYGDDRSDLSAVKPIRRLLARAGFEGILEEIATRRLSESMQSRLTQDAANLVSMAYLFDPDTFANFFFKNPEALEGHHGMTLGQLVSADALPLAHCKKILERLREIFPERLSDGFPDPERLETLLVEDDWRHPSRNPGRSERFIDRLLNAIILKYANQELTPQSEYLKNTLVTTFGHTHPATLLRMNLITADQTATLISELLSQYQETAGVDSGIVSLHLVDALTTPASSSRIPGRIQEALTALRADRRSSYYQQQRVEPLQSTGPSNQPVQPVEGWMRYGRGGPDL